MLQAVCAWFNLTKLDPLVHPPETPRTQSSVIENTIQIQPFECKKNMGESSRLKSRMS